MSEDMAVQEAEEPPRSDKCIEEEKTLLDEIVVQQREDTASSSSLPSLASHTPSRDRSAFLTRPAALYNDAIPSDAPYWVEIHPPKPPFDRELYEINDEEFNVVGITHHIGGDEEDR